MGESDFKHRQAAYRATPVSLKLHAHLTQIATLSLLAFRLILLVIYEFCTSDLCLLKKFRQVLGWKRSLKSCTSISAPIPAARPRRGTVNTAMSPDCSLRMNVCVLCVLHVCACARGCVWLHSSVTCFLQLTMYHQDFCHHFIECALHFSLLRNKTHVGTPSSPY